MRLHSVIILLVLFLSVGTVSAWTENSFSNGLTNESLLFNGTQNITRYLKIPTGVNYVMTNTFNINSYSDRYGEFFNGVNDSDTELYDGWAVGQTFKTAYVSDLLVVDTISFKVQRKGNGADSINLSLCNVNQSNDPDLGSCFVSETLSDNSAPTSFGWYNFTIPITILDNNQYYSVVIRGAGGVPGFNSLLISRNSTGGYPNGKIYVSQGTSSLGSGNSNIDALFYLFFNNQTSTNNTKITVGNQIVWFNNTGIYNNSDVINNLSSSLNTYLDSCVYVGGYCNVPFMFGSENGGILRYSSLDFGNEVISENSQSYNYSVSSGQLANFIANVSYDIGYFPSVTAVFNYNFTDYTHPTKTVVGPDTIFNISISVPVVSSLTQKTFYWEYIGTNLSGQTYSLNSYGFQNITTLAIDNCTSNEVEILNFSLLDEDTRTRLNGTIELITTLKNSQRTQDILQFNKSYEVDEVTTARVCVGQFNSTLSLDYQTKYYGNVSTYATEYKFADAISITNNTPTQNVKLYSLLDSESTAFTLIVQSPDLSVIEGAIVDVQRQYVPINQFLSVESPETNNKGEAIAHLVHNSVYYNFVVKKDGKLLGTFNNNLVQCQNFVTGDCRIFLNLIEAVPNLPDYNELGNITTAYSWLPSSRVLYLSYVSTDNLVHNVSWEVTKLDQWGNTTICTGSSSDTSGTLQCSVPTSYGNSSVLSELYSDGYLVGRNSFSFNDPTSSVFGGTRIIIGLLMYATLTLLMISNPVTLILGAILGMIFVVMFALVDGGTVIGSGFIVLWFVIAGAVLINYMRNKT